MRRDIFSEEHDLFRAQFRRFVAAEVAPNVLAWNEAGITPRAIWKRMGEEGYLGANQPVEYGGADGDFLYTRTSACPTSRATAARSRSGSGWCPASPATACSRSA
jgi:acyl-CoA dehydrogenase